MNAVQVFERASERGGGHVAAIHLPGVHGEIVADTAEAAQDAARYLRGLAAERTRVRDPLILTPAEFSVAKHVHGVIYGGGQA